MYKPLPDSLTIKKSPIHGLGLFAIKKINKGVDLGITHYVTKDKLIRTPLGGFVNSSNKPNVKLKREKGTRFLKMITINIINPDDELTGEYDVDKARYK